MLSTGTCGIEIVWLLDADLKPQLLVISQGWLTVNGLFCVFLPNIRGILRHCFSVIVFSFVFPQCSCPVLCWIPRSHLCDRFNRWSATFWVEGSIWSVSVFAQTICWFILYLLLMLRHYLCIESFVSQLIEYNVPTRLFQRKWSAASRWKASLCSYWLTNRTSRYCIIFTSQL